MRRRVDAMDDLSQALMDLENPALAEAGAEAVAKLIGSDTAPIKETRMERTPVKSSQLKSVGYDAAAERLECEFANGDVYAYTKVPPETHAALMAAESIGKFFAANVRWKFAFAKVPDQAEPATVASGQAFFTPDSPNLVKP